MIEEDIILQSGVHRWRGKHFEKESVCSRGDHEQNLPARPTAPFPDDNPPSASPATLQIQLQIPILNPPHTAQHLPKHKGQHSGKQEAHQKDAHPHPGSAAHGRIYADGAYQSAGAHAGPGIQIRGFSTILPICSMLVPRPWAIRPPILFSR